MNRLLFWYISQQLLRVKNDNRSKIIAAIVDNSKITFPSLSNSCFKVSLLGGRGRLCTRPQRICPRSRGAHWSETSLGISGHTRTFRPAAAWRFHKSSACAYTRIIIDRLKVREKDMCRFKETGRKVEREMGLAGKIDGWNDNIHHQQYCVRAFVCN